MTDTATTTGPYVDIVFIDDWSAEIAHPETTAPSIDLNSILSTEDVEAIAAYLAQWDYGTETDAAHTHNVTPWGNTDDLYHVTIGGLTYTLTVDARLDYVSLNRRPLASGE